MDVVRIFRNFACCTLDRFLILSGQARDLNLQIHLDPGVEGATRGQGGCIVLVSHLGSFEVLRQMSTAGQHAPLRVLLDRAHGAVLTGLFERLNPEFAGSIIDARTPGPQLILALREALRSGCNVGIMADRVRGQETSVEVGFLGGTARFPTAPWTLALLLGVPVVAAFALFRGGATYELRFEFLSRRIEARRDERQEVVHRCVQRYAEALERQMREAPYNWFNFFPFWLDESARN
jgi:predicted LPLAT superfamily acyltransferase